MNRFRFRKGKRGETSDLAAAAPHAALEPGDETWVRNFISRDLRIVDVM
jgi:hypothetical protein